ncbi:hypothetical protein MHM93_15105 [Pseudoalteromonas sp. MM17-2]|uniref:hypothetical protein n=1 Tax=Pseudoalteromonas sp. MM17-2 TaxID=2917753 RepID=UPI001EF656D3|nr:hypothetical protein [Pseudoalteromonas sp. MM17-2]MCG7545509.1 hypothetical protein [Pseudoalteromonas sp. MM17-2]
MKSLFILLALLSLLACSEPTKPGTNLSGQPRALLLKRFEAENIKYELADDGTIRWPGADHKKAQGLVLEVLNNSKK